MLKRFHFLLALICLSSTLALVGGACRSNQQTQNQIESGSNDRIKNSSRTQSQPSTTALHAKSEQKPSADKSASDRPNQYEQALDKASSAFSISQSAQSADDWQLVASQWQEAIALMQTLPQNSPYNTIAKTKAVEYRQHLIYAQQQANRTIHQNPNSLATSIPENPASEQGSQPANVEVTQQDVIAPNHVVYQAAIKRRVSGTPVIEVTFNGDRKFDMIVDTGASGTVLTQQTANALGLVPVARAKANTASAKAVEFPIGYVDSINVGGAVVRDIPVAIAPTSVLETGLLGHDFFGNYDVTIKRNVVEFRPQ